MKQWPSLMQFCYFLKLLSGGLPQYPLDFKRIGYKIARLTLSCITNVGMLIFLFFLASPEHLEAFQNFLNQ